MLNGLINETVEKRAALNAVTPDTSSASLRAQARRDLPEINPVLCAERDAAEMKYNRMSANHTLALAFGIPLLALSFALLAANEKAIFGAYATSNTTLNPFGRVMILWTIASLIALPIYYFVIYKGYVSARETFTRIEQVLIAARLSTPEARRQYFREELFRLSSKAARVFFGDEKRFAEASGWSEKAGNILDGAEGTAGLNVVQSCLNSLNELVTREEQEQKDENRWQYAAIAVMVLYFAGLALSGLYISHNQEEFKTLILGVPRSVIIWGAAGSLAAILYRFYTEQGRIRFAAEFRWLIARPIIGIIMGAVVYLALKSGMILVTAQESAQATVMAGFEPRMEAFWIIAFLAGFSDKFYLGVIDLLVARTVRTEEVDSNTVVTEIERIPEAQGNGSSQNGDGKKS
jgi:hypothetical protein